MIFNAFGFLRSYLWICVLVILILVSAIAVIYANYEYRSQFALLQMLQQKQGELEEEWGRLLLEEGVYTRPRYIEKQARTNLGMTMPNDVVIVMVP